MMEKAKVHTLPTEKATHKGLWYDPVHKTWGYYEGITKAQQPSIPHHLYFTSDEEKKSGDKVIASDNRVWEFREGIHPIPYWTNPKTCRKIVATTNPELWSKNLINAGIDEVRKGGLPRIQTDFIEAFVREQGIWEVMLEWNNDYHTEEDALKYFPKGRPKLNSQGAVVVHKVKPKMYTREEMRNACFYAAHYGFGGTSNLDTINDWFDKNYPK